MSVALTSSNVSLWQQDPRFVEYKRLKMAKEAAGLSSPEAQAFFNWNPIPQNSQINIAELRKHVHPATIKDNKLHRINDAALDAMRHSFMCEPKIEEEITNPTFVGRYITFHSYGLAILFKPSISEVLVQLPEKILKSKNNLYFTTEVISTDPNECTIESNYHIAVTNVYSHA